MTFFNRDTDKDWQKLGRENPYWGVLTAPEFHRDVITEDGIEQFYSTGRGHVGWLSQHILQHFGEALQVERALDFGCGVGRVTLAMTEVAKEAVGVDISPGMLEKARSRPSENVRFVSEIPTEGFDWIHSTIVFQHIPTKRGMVILKTLLQRLNLGGWVTLQFTFDRDAKHKPQNALSRLAQWVRSFLHPEGVIHMYDYDLGAIVSAIYRAGVSNLSIVPTNHDGHIGAYIIGRKDQSLRGAA